MLTRSWLLADSICRLRPAFAESRFSARIADTTQSWHGKTPDPESGLAVAHSQLAKLLLVALSDGVLLRRLSTAPSRNVIFSAPATCAIGHDEAGHAGCCGYRGASSWETSSKRQFEGFAAGSSAPGAGGPKTLRSPGRRSAPGEGAVSRSRTRTCSLHASPQHGSSKLPLKVYQ